MKVQYANRQPITWRVDEDGMMRITMRILKAGVYAYGAEEVPADAALAGKDTIQEYIPVEEFSKPEALLSLEGKPIVVTKHEWRDASNTLVDGYTVGTIAGRPSIDSDGLIVDALIYDAATQEKIKSGELVEVSAAYDGNIIVGDGVYNNTPYDAMQSDFRFNHVLLLPEGQGRCGCEVKIINSKPEEKTMADKAATLRVQIGNTTRTYRFSNEEDRAEAEGMLEEQKAFNAEEFQTALGEHERLTKQIEELKAQLAEHDKHLAEAKDEIERLLSSEVQESLAEEAAEQRLDEDEVITDATETALEGENVNSAVIEEEKEKITNSVRSGANFAERRRNIVALAFANQRREIPESWTQEAIDGAFEAVVLAARQRNAVRKAQVQAHAQPTSVLNGKQTPGTPVRTSNSARERMLRPMQVRNNKEGK